MGDVVVVVGGWGGGGGGMGAGKREVIHLSLHCHHQNDPCGRAEADSNRCPFAYQPNALPLGQTGSH